MFRAGGARSASPVLFLAGKGCEAMISGAEVKRLSRLHRKKYREIERVFLAEGRAVISESSISPIQTISEPEDISRISTLTTPTGPIAVFRFVDREPEELLSSMDRVLLLHGVQDPGNVGTAIRAAQAFGAGVALSKGCADLYNPKTVRGTMGSLFHVPIAREVETLDLIQSAQNRRFTVAAAIPDGGKPPNSLPVGKLLILVGAEGGGLPKDVIVESDARVSIPALAPSLNAAVAAAILLHEAYSRVLP